MRMKSFELPEKTIIAGGNGSGKSTLSIVREEALQIPGVDLSDVLRIEATRRGLDPTDRSVLRAISTEWSREVNSPDVMAQKTMAHFEGHDAFTAVSIRRPAEAEYFKKRGAALIWVDAPVIQRWQNVNARARDEGDKKTLEEFITIEDQEMFSPNPEDPYLINMVAVRAMADFVYVNTEPTLEAAKLKMAETFGLPYTPSETK